jgi:hypothetical protein
MDGEETLRDESSSGFSFVNRVKALRVGERFGLLAGRMMHPRNRLYKGAG